MAYAVSLPFAEDEIQLGLSHVHASTWSRLDGHRLFFTGGTGFVGKWLLSILQAARERHGFDCEATVLSRDPDAFARQAPHLALAPGIRLVRGDVVDFQMPEGPIDAVVHAATDVASAGSPLETFEACLLGTRRVLDFAARSGARDFLLVSSGAMYGRQPPELAAISEQFGGAPDVMATNAGYGHGKRIAEWLANVSTKEHGQRLVIARLFAFVGPGMPLDGPFAIANFVRDAMTGSPIVIEGDGTPCRSYLHAADMAGWLWRIFFDGRPGEAYNVGSPEELSIADLAHRVKGALGSASEVEVRGQKRPGLSAERYVPDVRKARDELGLEVSIPLDDGIRRTARWHRQREHSACA